MGIKGYHLIYLLLTAFFLSSCEDDPDISLSASPQAVIFGVFNEGENIHYLKVGKTFHSDADPNQEANIFDSLYFDAPDVTISLTNWNGHSEIIRPTIVREIPKDEGIFHNPNQIIYNFEGRIRGKLGVSVKYPGMKEAYGEVKLIDKPFINTPKKAQQYLYLAPDSPIRIQWSIDQEFSQDFWFEVDVSFGFLEEMEDTIRTVTMNLQNTNWNETMTPKYQELSITYEEFIRELLSQIDDNPKVSRRYFAYHSIKINMGGSAMTNYIKYLDGFNDFDFLAFSNIINGIGLLASRSSTLKDSMQFDRDTKKFLLNDNRLKKYKCIDN